jgi:ferrous iron transport protein A
VNAETLPSPLLPPEASVADPGGRAAPAGPAAGQRLDGAPTGLPCTVRRVDADPQVPERARQLVEIGFFPGEQVMVMARGFPGGEPLVVRVGQSTFALRGAEAACVLVDPVAGGAAA